MEPPLPDVPAIARSLEPLRVVSVPPVQAIRRCDPAEKRPVPDEMLPAASVPPASV